MKSPEVNRLILSIGGLICMFEAISMYNFSFMGVPALLSCIVLFIALAYFNDTLFFYIWGLFTGVIIFIPLVIALFNSSNNYIAYAIDGILSLLFISFFGFKTFKRLQIIKENKV